MDRSKNKKQAAQIYVPPSLRQKKMEDFDEGSSSNISGAEELSPSPKEKLSDNQPPEANSSNKKKRGSESSLDRKDSSSIDQKATKGRGRGRRKPEIEVYVPRAMRVAKHDSKSKLENNSEDSKEEKVSAREKERNGVERKNGKSNDSIDDKEGLEHEEMKGSCDMSNVANFVHSEVPDNYLALNNSNSSNSDCICNQPQPSSEIMVIDDLESGMLGPCGADLTEKSTPNTGNNPLTFEFYDPAVIAFLPSPKEIDNNDFHFPSEEVLRSTVESSNSSLQERLHLENMPQDFTQISSDNNENLATFNFDELNSSHCQEREKPAQAVVNNFDSMSSSAPSHFIIQKTEDCCLAEQPEKTKPHVEERSKEDESSCIAVNSKLSSKFVNEKLVDEDENENEEDSWDVLFDDNGDCLDDSVMKEITDFVGKVEIDKPKINYLNFTPKEPDLDMRVFGHIIEIYDFPAELATHDLITAFRDFSSRGFDIKWVDDTHALGVFSSSVAANEALKMNHPMLKVRPMSEASKKGQSKAKNCSEFLQPYKARPETTSIAARRLVAGALGMAPTMSREVREQERKKLKDAKEKRRRDRQQKNDIWDGTFGACAMDMEDSTR